jgi:hypothetical protein
MPATGTGQGINAAICPSAIPVLPAPEAVGSEEFTLPLTFPLHRHPLLCWLPEAQVKEGLGPGPPCWTLQRVHNVRTLFGSAFMGCF